MPFGHHKIIDRLKIRQRDETRFDSVERVVCLPKLDHLRWVILSAGSQQQVFGIRSHSIAATKDMQCTDAGDFTPF